MGVRLVSMSKLRAVVVGVAMSASLIACSPMERFHGFIPPQEELASLQIGVSAKDEVIALLGQPIAERGLRGNTIYYAASRFERLGPFAPQEVDREVLAVAFDSNDRLRNVSRYTLEDGRVIVLDRRVTDDGIEDITFLRQLLSSLGRIDAGTLLGDGT